MSTDAVMVPSDAVVMIGEPQGPVSPAVGQIDPRPLAVVRLAPDGWRVDFCGPSPVPTRYFTTESETAEFVARSRYEGGWIPLYDKGAETIQQAVFEIDMATFP